MQAQRDYFPHNFLFLLFSLPEPNKRKLYFSPYFSLFLFHLPCFHPNQMESQVLNSTIYYSHHCIIFNRAAIPKLFRHPKFSSQHVNYLHDSDFSSVLIPTTKARDRHQILLLLGAQHRRQIALIGICGRCVLVSPFYIKSYFSNSIAAVDMFN